MYDWLLLIFLIELFVWLLWIEVPRLNRLLLQIKRQQHGQVLRIPGSSSSSSSSSVDGASSDSSGSMEGEDADSAALHAHAESLQFIVEPLELTVRYTEAGDCSGGEREDTGVAEVLSVRDQGQAAGTPGRPLFLMVPGNPGLVNFYKLFMLYMHRLTKGAVEVSAVHTNEAERMSAVQDCSRARSSSLLALCFM